MRLNMEQKYSFGLKLLCASFPAYGQQQLLFLFEMCWCNVFKYYFGYVLLGLSMTEVSVTRKGQITIPVELRRKFGIEESSKVEVVEEKGQIVIKKHVSIFDLAGTGKGDVNELKKALDLMREEDA